MITQLQLERFKKFRALTVDLAPFTVLMGENSSGKTSVLQALNLALVSLHANELVSIDVGKNVRVRAKGVGLTKLPGIELADFRELYYGKRSRASRTEKWIGTTILLRDEKDNVFRLQITSLFGGFNVKCISRPEDFPSLPKVQEKPPLLISGFVGLSPTEERVFPVALIDRLRSGHVSAVIRNLVLDTQQSAPNKYDALRRRLADDFDFYLDSVLFNEDRDLFVTAQYSEPCEDKSLSLDFNASGSGFMQVLQILAPIYRFCPEQAKIVLLDEPDAHLHPNLQTTLANSLRRIRDELGIQIIISTHSTSIIRSAAASEVIPISERTTHCRPLTTKTDVEEHIKSKIDSYSLAKSVISGKLAFFEDSDLTIWEQIDDVLSTRVFKGASTVPVVTGRGKTDRVPFQIRDILAEVLGEEIEVIFVRDGDGMPPGWRKKLQHYASTKGVTLHVLEYFELESYLLCPTLLARVLQRKYPDQALPPTDEIEACIIRYLQETITLSRYNYDDNLEEEIYQAGILMSLGEFRNLQTVKSEVREWHRHLETLNTLDDLRRYGQGKEALSSLFNWLNERGLNVSKSDLIQGLQRDDIPSNLLDTLSCLLSRDIRHNPTPLPPMPEESDQADIETKIEQLMLDLDI